MFDKTRHAKKLLETEQSVAYALMLSDGMRSASNLMNEKQYVDMAAGAFGLMRIALDKAFEIISEEGAAFVSGNGLEYPLEHNSKE